MRPTTARPKAPRIEPQHWIDPGVGSILDIGCNTGDLLRDLHAAFPAARLTGCDINPAAVELARTRVPAADIRTGRAEALPFPDAAFDCVTCIEVFEHLPAAHRRGALAEMRRVLVPGGRLVLRTPHAGWFAWLDTNNVRFRFPRVYDRLVGRGRRDDGFADGSAGVHWHYHFTREELVTLAGPGWEVEATVYGGLVVFPCGDYFRWPFYRLRMNDCWLNRAITRVMSLDYRFDFGRASYGILLALRKTG